jgi:hypothetical protein
MDKLVYRNQQTHLSEAAVSKLIVISLLARRVSYSFGLQSSPWLSEFLNALQAADPNGEIR